MQVHSNEHADSESASLGVEELGAITRAAARRAGRRGRRGQCCGVVVPVALPSPRGGRGRERRCDARLSHRCRAATEHRPERSGSLFSQALAVHAQCVLCLSLSLSLSLSVPGDGCGARTHASRVSSSIRARPHLPSSPFLLFLPPLTGKRTQGPRLRERARKRGSRRSNATKGGATLFDAPRRRRLATGTVRPHITVTFDANPFLFSQIDALPLTSLTRTMARPRRRAGGCSARTRRAFVS